MHTDPLYPEKGKLFRTVRVDPDISGLLETHGVQFKGEIESTFVREMLSWVLPIVIFVGIWFEERDLAAHLGPDYEAYRRRTPMLVPLPRPGASRPRVGRPETSSSRR